MLGQVASLWLLLLLLELCHRSSMHDVLQLHYQLRHHQMALDVHPHQCSYDAYQMGSCSCHSLPPPLANLLAAH